jgi:ferredoxin--NADP+ reductase
MHHAVQEVRWHGPEVYELVVDRKDLAFTVGDCIALYNKEETLSRPYSIASGIGENVLRFVIRRMPGGIVSPELADLQPGDQVRVDPPFGWFRPGANSDGDFIFIATGTGIGPFLAYLRSHPERPPARCLYGVRRAHDAADLAFLEDACDFTLAVSRENNNGYHHGRVTDLLHSLPLKPDSHVYLCGLDSMIDEVSDWCEDQGLDFPQIHREVFFNAPS